MSKIVGVIVVVLSLIAGFGGGWVYELTLGKSTSTAATADTAAEEKTLGECLTEVWGADKYAAISANSSLATTEDNLASLKCYKD